ncbi:MAG: tRNA (guanosine(18)-2'-O)-methyltransferase TrmH [Wenzhouxiangellaceae bacterium]
MTPERRARVEAVLATRQPDLTVLMERVHKPHNFSAVLRTADAVGALEAHAVLAHGRMPELSGTSRGAEKWVKVHTYPTTTSALEQLQQRGFRCYAAHFSERARDFRTVDYTQPTAIILGTEYHGVSPEALAQVDGEIIIPMIGMTQSLNVSVANSVILYEAQRQRELAGMYEQCRLDDESYQRLRFEWLYPRQAQLLREQGEPYPPIEALA